MQVKRVVCFSCKQTCKEDTFFFLPTNRQETSLLIQNVITTMNDCKNSCVYEKKKMDFMCTRVQNDVSIHCRHNQFYIVVIL